MRTRSNSHRLYGGDGRVSRPRGSTRAGTPRTNGARAGAAATLRAALRAVFGRGHWHAAVWPCQRRYSQSLHPRHAAEAMPPIPRSRPDFLDTQQRVPRKGVVRWRNAHGSRLWEWDWTHGHIEGYDARGNHVGVFDAHTGVRIAPAVAGRKIDV